MSSSNYPMGFPTKYVNWKGKTFYQIVSSIQKNTKNAPTISVARLRHALPLTIYRREIGIKAPTVCSRASMKIFDFETPGNNIVSETQKPSYNNNGLLGNVEDMTPTTLSAENGSCNTQTSCFLSPQNNARKRCRSSGMIPKKFNINKNNDTYATSTQQYLTSRNMTIKQNEYNYIRKGSSGIDPGPGAASNIYSPGGLSHCYQPQVSVTNNNNVFYYVWADGQTYTVTIPNGLYNVESLNQYFQTAQIQNKTYFVGAGLSKNFLMNISYNTSTNSVILYAGVISQGSCTSNGYTEPSGATWTIAGFPLTDPTPTGAGVSGATYFQIPLNTNFSNLVGFVPGIYFAGINNSAFAGDITPKYVALYYKPNNSGFGVQGAVDASTRLQRLKYNTITTAAGSLRSPYGDAAANALAYGVSEQGYTIKTQVGDKVIYTPVINKQTGQLCRKRIIYR